MTQFEQFKNLNDEAHKLSNSFPYKIEISFSRQNPWLFTIFINEVLLFKSYYRDCMSLLKKLKNSLPLNREKVIRMMEESAGQKYEETD